MFMCVCVCICVQDTLDVLLLGDVKRLSWQSLEVLDWENMRVVNMILEEIIQHNSLVQLA